ncbi:ral guanine nucleotide dissociation stimulator-like [Camelus ferus]|uniref:Ral guanine nucleotide dissociation stimulator-like n=1 Tax=Camelus ferus TaxID=419612 RepID=A0A8B8U0C3_CAMFR|nr:ral guanine nucleotide dissociation stimulator-like [Camelus ferus]
MASSLQQHKLEKLVANLVPAALGGHPSYLHTFLGTYRALATTQQVLDLLFQRYGCILPYTYDDSGPLHQLKHTSSKPAGETLLDREPATPLLPETAPEPEQRTVLS